jgi:hypothetical protein
MRLPQNGGASRAQYSRSLATSVAVERSPVDRRPIPVVVIEHASTSSGTFNSFSKIFVLCVYFLMISIYLFCCSHGASATTVPPYLFIFFY